MPEVVLVATVAAVALAVALVVRNEHMVHMGVVTNILSNHQMKHRQLRLIQLLETLVRLDYSENTASHIRNISSL